MTFKTLAAMVALALIASTTAASAEQAYVSAQLNVRDGPGTRYDVIDVLRRGEIVDIDYCEGTWCFVRKSGPNGWVSAKFLRSERYDYDDDVDVDIEFSFGNRFPRRIYVPDNDPPITRYPTLNPDGSQIYGNNACYETFSGLVCY
jgi:uncharacterized protein YgiM (DUF1202 family)